MYHYHIALKCLTSLWLGDHIFGLLPLLASRLNGAGGTADGMEDPRAHIVQGDVEVRTSISLILLLVLKAAISLLKFTGPWEPGHIFAVASSIHIPYWARPMLFTNCAFLLTRRMGIIPHFLFMRLNRQMAVISRRQTVYGQMYIVMTLFRLLRLPSCTPYHALVTF